MQELDPIDLILGKDLKSAFLAAAKSAHRPAEAVLRDLAQEYVAAQHDKLEHDAFVRIKIAAGRSDMQSGTGRDNRDVEATFAELRARLTSNTK